MYTTMLNIIYAQLLTFPDNTLACYGLMQSNGVDEDIWISLQHLLGWKNRANDFNEYMKGIYQPPTTLSLQEQQDLVPSQFKLYMDSFIQAHRLVVSLCQEQTQEQTQQKARPESGLFPS